MSFRQDVDRVFLELAEEVAELGVRKIALTSYSTLVKTTPVRTGRARNGWVATTGRASEWAPEPGGDTYPAPEPVPEATTGAKLGEDVVIANNVNYVGFLDEGSSQQAPAGMTSILESQLVAQFGVTG